MGDEVNICDETRMMRLYERKGIDHSFVRHRLNSGFLWRGQGQQLGIHHRFNVRCRGIPYDPKKT